MRLCATYFSALGVVLNAMTPTTDDEADRVPLTLVTAGRRSEWDVSM